MKFYRILILAAVVASFGVFAQQDVALYEFAPKTATTVETAVTTETKAPETDAVSTTTESVPSQDVLVADAQSLIKDKLVQKYQIALDDVITRLTGKLNMVSAEAQRKALNELHARLEEKKADIIEQKNIDPLKQEIITALLDHLIVRIDGLIKQSAQTQTKSAQV